MANTDAQIARIVATAIARACKATGAPPEDVSTGLTLFTAAFLRGFYRPEKHEAFLATFVEGVRAIKKGFDREMTQEDIDRIGAASGMQKEKLQ